MKRGLGFPLVAAFAAALFLSSCDALFQTNLFGGTITPGNIDTLSGEQIIERSGIFSDKPSGSFFDSFSKADPESQKIVAGKVLDYFGFAADDPLRDIFGPRPLSASARNPGAGTMADRQQGLVALAQLKLHETVDLQKIGNDAMAIIVGLDFSAPDVAYIEEVFEAIPAALRADETAFSVMVAQLLDLDSIYDRLAALIRENGGAFVPEISDAVRGDTAQMAIIACIVRMVNPAAGTYTDGVFSVSVESGESGRAKALFTAVNHSGLVIDHQENWPMLYATPDTLVADLEREVIDSGNLSDILKASGFNLDIFRP